jgi:hypothetical protein
MVAPFWCRGDPCAYWIQVDVYHRSENRRIVEQCLATEATFPEAAGAIIFAIRASCDRFVEIAHEPTQVAEAFAQCLQAFGLGEESGYARL